MERTSAPWHLWVVGGVALAWNGFGVVDYILTRARPQTYLRGMGLNDEQIAFFQALPDWMIAVWALGVWAGLTASVHLLLRRRWALPLFAGSLVAIVLSLLYQFVLTDGAAVMGTSALVMSVVVAASCVFFTLYSWAMKQRGELR